MSAKGSILERNKAFSSMSKDEQALNARRSLLDILQLKRYLSVT
jgi:hypothetical protein